MPCLQARGLLEIEEALHLKPSRGEVMQLPLGLPAKDRSPGHHQVCELMKISMSPWCGASGSL